MSSFKGKGEDLDPLAGLRFKQIQDSGLTEPLLLLYNNKEKIKDLVTIQSTAKNIDKTVTSVDPDEVIKSQYIKTTERLLINLANRAELPTPAVGDIIWNMALIFNDLTSNVVIKEVTVTTDGKNLFFDELDNVKSKYCVVSYLTYKAL